MSGRWDLLSKQQIKKTWSYTSVFNSHLHVNAHSIFTKIKNGLPKMARLAMKMF